MLDLEFEMFMYGLLQDLRALALLLSVHTPKQLNPALIPTLQELLSKCRTCLQQRNSLQEQEAKERKTKGECYGPELTLGWEEEIHLL